MKKLLLTIALVTGLQKVDACAFDPYYGSEYYNLFSQELIDAPQYYPLLNGNSYIYYYHSPAVENIRNENLEDWAKKLNITYDQAKALVFDAPKSDVDALVKNAKISNANLNFINADFVKKHKQELLYISYAKYLEPYMQYYNPSETWGYVENKQKSISDLDYAKVISVLTKSWNAETDKDLKIRYGYQLVRFAHYNGNFEKAVNYFDQYVASLNYKPVMYYYALDQKAGALRGLGKVIQANADFFEVFSNTKNRKESALSSMFYTQDLDFNKMLTQAKTEQEKLDAYLLIGYQNFSDPIALIKKMTAINADAVQAKVLMAKTVNVLEYNYLPQYYGRIQNEQNKKVRIPFDTGNLRSTWNIDYDYFANYDDEVSSAYVSYMKDAIALCKTQMNQSQNKTYWTITLAYLQTLSQNYSEAKQILANLDVAQNEEYSFQKQIIESLIFILEQDKIDAKFEEQLYSKYKSILTHKVVRENDYDYYSIDDGLSQEKAQANLKNYIWDVLANRYYLQNEHAKAFLIHNDIYALGYNPDWTIINDLEKFDQKKNKTSIEKLIIQKLENSIWNQVQKNTLKDFVHNYKGTKYLIEQKFDEAIKEFSGLNPKFKLNSTTQEFYDYYAGNEVKRYNQYDGNNNISANVFGYNVNECFRCDEDWTMNAVYTNEFSFIKKKMNKLELAQALKQLNQLAKKSGEQAAKANLLLGDFYYNTSVFGYFRELLTFDFNNLNGEKFRESNAYRYYYDYNKKPNYNVYYKEYSWNVYTELPNNSTAEKYLTEAKKLAKDQELRAHILFGLSKTEQVNFYNLDYKEILNIKEDSYWLDDAQEEKLLAYKRKNYRKNFIELKNYKDTKAYDEMTNCLYFDYFVNHF